MPNAPGWQQLLNEEPSESGRDYSPGYGFQGRRTVWSGAASIGLHAAVLIAIFLGYIGTQTLPPPKEPATALQLAPVPASPPAPPAEVPPGPEQDEVRELVQPKVEEVPVPPEPLVRLPDPPQTVSKQEPQPQPQPQPTPQQRPPAEQTTRPQPNQAQPQSNAGAPVVGNPNRSVEVRDASWGQRVAGLIERRQVRPSNSGPEEVDTVIVRLTLDRSGRLISQSIISSRGFARLNSASLEAVRRASPFPPPPAPAGVNTLTVNVAVRWTMNNVRGRRR